MKIGLLKEIKEGEYRVAIIPSNVAKLVDVGHEVYVEHDAGTAAGFTDDMYVEKGAVILSSAQEVYKECELIIKVKEVLPPEFDLLEEKHTVFTYIHSANRRPQTEALLKSKCVAFAYEDVRDKNTGRQILLEPMSRIAGEIGLLTGVFYSFTTTGGLGKLICGNPGVKPMKVVIFGAGFVGVAAARLAVRLNADVVLMDTNISKLEYIMDNQLEKVRTCYSSKANIEREIADADLILNAVKWVPGLRLISKEQLKLIQPNALIVDIDAEPDGGIETSRYTTHENPVYYVDGIRHICIANLPSSVANTAAISLSNATIDYIMEIADKGWKKAAIENENLLYGLDFVKGHLTFKDTADAFGIELADKETVLKMF